VIVTEERLRRMFGSGSDRLIKAIVKNWDYAEDSGISTPKRIQFFIATIGVETGGLRSIEENLSYSAKRLTEVWPKRFPTQAAAKPYAYNPQALAEKVYGGRKDLGNRKGDGWAFRGSGYFQTTGRANFARSGAENDPDSLRDPDAGFRAACDFVRNNGLNRLADAGDVAGYRKRVNGGTTGLSEFKTYLDRADNIFVNISPAMGLMSPPVAAEPQPTATKDEAAPAVPFLDEDGDGLPDPVKTSSSLEELQGKLAQVNAVVDQVALAKDSSIARIGTRVIKGGLGTAVGAPAVAGLATASNWQAFQQWANDIPWFVWVMIILAHWVIGGMVFAFYGYFNVQKRLLLQRSGQVLPAVKTA